MPLRHSLSQAHTVGDGEALDTGVGAATHTMVVVSGPGVSAGAVQLEASLDGENWVQLGGAVSTSTAGTVFAPVTQPGAYRFTRASVTTAITGGVVDAWVCSA